MLKFVWTVNLVLTDIVNIHPLQNGHSLVGEQEPGQVLGPADVIWQCAATCQYWYVTNMTQSAQCDLQTGKVGHIRSPSDRAIDLNVFCHLSLQSRHWALKLLSYFYIHRDSNCFLLHAELRRLCSQRTFPDIITLHWIPFASERCVDLHR